IKLESLTEALRQASVFWIALSVIISIWGYWLRAWRWKLLIEADDNRRVKTTRVFLALMTGYLVNLLIPRAGEVARCGVLKKSDNLQMGKLLGTVILERTVDLLFLIGVFFLVFVAENRIFLSLIGDLVSLETLLDALTDYLPILIGFVLAVVILGNWGFNKYGDRGLVKKARHFIQAFLGGRRSVGNLRIQWGFWSSSAMTCFIYSVIMYWVAKAYPA